MNSHDDLSTAQDEDPEDGIRIFPRRKLHEGEQRAAYPEPMRGRPPLKLNLKTVESVFDLPQKDAALKFGISLTAFKQVCRKLGINCWPYRRPSKVIRIFTAPLLALSVASVFLMLPPLATAHCRPKWVPTAVSFALRCVADPFLADAMEQALARDPDDINANGHTGASPPGLLPDESLQHAETQSNFTRDYTAGSKCLVPPLPASSLSNRHGVFPLPSLQGAAGRAGQSGQIGRKMRGREIGISQGLSPASSSFHCLDLMGPALGRNLPFFATQPSVNNRAGPTAHSAKGNGWSEHMGSQAAESDSVYCEEIYAMPNSSRRQPNTILGISPMLTYASNRLFGGGSSSKDNVEPARKAAKVQRYSVMLSTQNPCLTQGQCIIPSEAQVAMNSNSSQSLIELNRPPNSAHMHSHERRDLSSRHPGNNTTLMTLPISKSEMLIDTKMPPPPPEPLDDEAVVLIFLPFSCVSLRYAWYIETSV